MEHLEKIPRQSFQRHQNLPILQNMIRDTIACFRMLEMEGIAPKEYIEYVRQLGEMLDIDDEVERRKLQQKLKLQLKLSPKELEDYVAMQQELAHAYSSYRDLLKTRGMNTWYGIVLDTLQLAEQHPYLIQLSMEEFSHVLVDDMHTMTPAMVKVSETL